MALTTQPPATRSIPVPPTEALPTGAPPTEALPTVETRFRAMGTDVHVVISGGSDHHLRLARTTICDLERRWSRFLPHSEISALNRNAGVPSIVSPETYELVTKAIAAWAGTEGRFDPTVGAAMVAHGYDRDFAALRAARPTVARTAPAPTPEHIVLAPQLHGVTLPDGVVFDPGGIGKGLAADLTATAVVDAGARGALVNIGGDLRAIGTPPSADGWVITIPEPTDPDRELLRLAIPRGGVATSSNLRRRWHTTTGEAHHLVDPATGRPATTSVTGVTVVAAESWWAEALTKSLYLLGPAALASLEDAHAVIVTSDGTRHATADMEGALR